MFTTAFSQLFNAKRVGLFLVSAIAIGVSSNAVFELLRLGLNAIAVAALAIAVLFGTAGFLWYLVLRHGPIIPPARALPVARRGLILLVGREDYCLEAINHHAPSLRHLWLICSRQSEEVANKLAASTRLPSGVTCAKVVVNDAYGPSDVFDAVVEIYRKLGEGWRPTDVIADFTGMTAPASVGMVLACLQTGGSIEYTPAEYNQDLRPVRPLPPYEVMFVPVARHAPPISPEPHGVSTGAP